MKEIINKKLIEKLCEENNITKHLKEEGVEFRLYQYDNSEILIDMLEATKELQFIVRGTIQIYAVRSNGSKYPITQIDKFTVLGDIELYNMNESPLLVEAKSTVLCLNIPIENYRERLLEDNEFLRFIVKELSQKLVLCTKSEVLFSSLEEKFLAYITEECEDNMITSVEETVFKMKCSRRQLQRVLKKLVDEKIIFKVKKGCYRLLQ